MGFQAYPSDAHLVPEKSIHEFIVKDCEGNDVALSKYKGKIIVLLNVASRCGLTDINYRELVELHNNLKGDGLEILAFPSNDFGNMEPGSNKDILDFARSKYKATFPIFAKIEVMGPNQAPLYKFLKATKGGILGKYRDNIKWNFAKFIIDREGVIIERFPPTTSPKVLEKFLRSLLFEKPTISKPVEVVSTQCSTLARGVADCAGRHAGGGKSFWKGKRAPPVTGEVPFPLAENAEKTCYPG